ncbi:MAG: CoA-transferase [Evtepia sp.]
MENTKYTTQELMACVLSREIEDGKSLQCGANAVVQRSGMLLAHLHHGPNMRILIGRTYSNLYTTPVLQLYDSNVDYRAARWGEYIIPHDESFSFATRHQIDNFAIGVLQCDKYGNGNMVGIGTDYNHMKVRGPGGVGTTPVGAYVDYFIFVMKHSKKVFVEKCDFVTSIGFGDGPNFRKEQGLPGIGPRIIITDLCVFDFDEKSKRVRLRSVHEGVSVQQVIDNTGFEIVMPKGEVPVTPPPTLDEITILRNRVDPTGMLRK